ncbi:MAG: hypothetical protein QNK05_05925 [Myxococcota bacterium]|nr:hypothetical protein [Myxococcota bacterium]
MKSSTPVRRSHARSLRRLLGMVFLAAGLVFAAPAVAHEDHRSNEAGHPLRIIAYALHPIGVVIDTVVFKPAHWLVHRAEWLEVLFGHEDEY